MMLSDEEKTNLIRQFDCGVWDFIELVERAVLAKASQQVQGEAVKDAQKALEIYLAGFGDLDGDKWQDYPASQVFIDGFNAAMKAMPAPKQEPVGWNTQCSCGHRWVMDLPTENCPKCNPEPPQAAAIPEGFKVVVQDGCMVITAPDGGQEVFYPDEASYQLISAMPSAAPKPCPSCNGLGSSSEILDSEKTVTCPDCAGTGSAQTSITVIESEVKSSTSPEPPSSPAQQS